MGRFAQLVIGPAGSGKVGLLKMKLLQAQPPDAGSQLGHCCLQSTYCDNLRQHCEAIGRTVHVVNLGEPSINLRGPYLSAGQHPAQHCPTTGQADDKGLLRCLAWVVCSCTQPTGTDPWCRPCSRGVQVPR